MPPGAPGGNRNEHTSQTFPGRVERARPEPGVGRHHLAAERYSAAPGAARESTDEAAPELSSPPTEHGRE